MTDVAPFTDQERSLFRQRKVLAPLLGGVAVTGSALSAMGVGGLALTIAFVVALVILGFGTLATEHGANLARFDPLLDEARAARVGTLRFIRKVLRGLIYGVVILMPWLDSVRGDLPIVLVCVLAAAAAGLYAQILFYKEVALLRTVADLPA